MECVFCDGRTRVISTRKNNAGRNYRRRECLECGERFTTYETSEIDLLNMLDKYLPERLVDEISNRLSGAFSDKKT